MKIDLRKCKNGTKLICRDGKECTYEYSYVHDSHPHCIRMSCGYVHAFTDEGYFNDIDEPDDYDIVEIKKEEEIDLKAQIKKLKAIITAQKELITRLSEEI